MVVVSLVALATAGVSMALRDTSASQLEREGQRVAALLEAARAQARGNGVAAIWKTVPGGFAIDQTQRPWLAPGTVAQLERMTQPAPHEASNPNPQRMVLGPEPLMAPTSLRLTLEGRSLWLSTDGLRPFSVNSAPDEAWIPAK